MHATSLQLKLHCVNQAHAYLVEARRWIVCLIKICLHFNPYLGFARCTFLGICFILYFLHTSYILYIVWYFFIFRTFYQNDGRSITLKKRCIAKYRYGVAIDYKVNYNINFQVMFSYIRSSVVVLFNSPTLLHYFFIYVFACCIINRRWKIFWHSLELCIWRNACKYLINNYWMRLYRYR